MASDEGLWETYSVRIWKDSPNLAINPLEDLQDLDLPILSLICACHCSTHMNCLVQSWATRPSLLASAPGSGTTSLSQLIYGISPILTSMQCESCRQANQACYLQASAGWTPASQPTLQSWARHDCTALHHCLL